MKFGAHIWLRSFALRPGRRNNIRGLAEARGDRRSAAKAVCGLQSDVIGGVLARHRRHWRICAPSQVQWLGR